MTRLLRISRKNELKAAWNRPVRTVVCTWSDQPLTAKIAETLHLIIDHAISGCYQGENVPRDYPTNVRVVPADSGLPMETVFLCFQIRSLDQNRFPEVPAGKVGEQVMQRIEDAVRYCLDL